MHGLTLAAIVFLGFIFFEYSNSQNNLQAPVVYDSNKNQEVTQQELSNLRAYVDQKFADLPESSDKIVTEKIVEKVSVGEDKKQTSYIPIAQAFETRSTDWITVSDSGAYVDIANDFDKDAYVTWEANLKVGSGGEVYVRLWDDTNKIVVNSSELSSAATQYEYKYSSQLALWRGNNLYKVQIKSKDSNLMYLGGAKIKVVY